MERFLPLVLALSVSLPAPVAAQEAPRSAPEPPVALHLGSFSSVRAGRLGVDGLIDSGAGVVSIGDGSARLALDDLHYGPGPTLVGHFSGDLGGLRVEGVAACAGIGGGGDERSVIGVQLQLVNDGPESVRQAVVIGLHPGGGDPDLRPVPSLELQPETHFALEDGVITRDGRALMRWLGGDPTVEVFERVASPWGRAATLTFDLDVPPGGSRYLEVELAGPSTVETADEAAWRASFLRRTFRDIEEGLRWQWQVRGRFGNFVSPVPKVARTILGSMQVLRSFGVAHREASRLTDRPYGHPPRDAAVEAEIYGAFMQVNLDEITASQGARLTGDLDRVLESLTPERRVAYLHGLVQGLRLCTLDETSLKVARAVVEHAEAVPVRAWLDPALVRLDLATFVDECGVAGADEIPEMLWADVADDDSLRGLLQATRRALSAGRADDAWESFDAFLSRGYRGVGRWDGVDDIDGRYAIAALNIVREMIVDDRGDRLLLFPNLPASFLELGSEVHVDFTPTRFGQVRAQLYAVGRKNIGMWVRTMRGLRQGDLVAYMPEGFRPRRLLGKPTGGEAQILEDGGLRLWVDEVGTTGLRLSAGVGVIPD